MAAAKPFRLDHRQIAELLKSDQFRPAVRAEAEKIAARARANAPVDSGEYRDSITVESLTPHDRAALRVIAKDLKAAIVEARTGNLKRALGG